MNMKLTRSASVKSSSSSRTSGFTLIELLVVLTIIGILLSISFLGLTNSRKDARDTRRKADLEEIRSGLELYKADCGEYPPSATVNGLFTSGGSLTGDPTECAGYTTVKYISAVPNDPNTSNKYFYERNSGNTTIYKICASLESVTSGSCTISGFPNCGAGTCNYQVTQP